MTTTELDNLRQSVGVKQALADLTGSNEGDTGLDVSNEITDGTHVVLTSMVDGLERPPIPVVHAERVLRKTLADGSPAFWIPGLAYTPPKPIAGSIKCMLHPDFDETNGPAGFGREFVDQSGLSGFFCNRGDPSKPSKDNFTSVFDRDQHMKHKHKTQWELIEAAIAKDEERDEKAQRQLDREVLMALARSAGGQVGAPRIQVEPPIEEPGINQQIVVETVACDICGREFKDGRGVAGHKRFSKDPAHIEARG